MQKPFAYINTNDGSHWYIVDGQWKRFNVLSNPVKDEEPAPRDSAAVDRTLTLSAAHRLLGQLADDTLSRETLAECRDVMAKLEKMVADA